MRRQIRSETVRGGRPRNRVNISLSGDDYSWVESLADASGLTVSSVAATLVRMMHDAARESYALLDAAQTEAIRAAAAAGWLRLQR